MSLFNKKGKGNSIIIVVIVAAIVAFGLFAYLQLNNTTAFVVEGGILNAGTVISEDLLANGTIVIKEIPKSMANDYLITDFDEINGTYVKDTLRPGKTIFAYDIAKSGDLRNNEILTTYDLEAVTLKDDQIQGLSDVVNKGDKVNVYGTYQYDLSAIKESYGGMTFPIEALNKELQQVFLDNGYKLDDEIIEDTVVITKLLLQNVPVVDVSRDDYEYVTKLTIGVGPEHAEAIYGTLQTTGRVGITVLPYNDGNYVEKKTKGTISSLELSNKGTIEDVNSNDSLK